MEVDVVHCLICCGECRPSSHVIGGPRERSSDKFLGPLCQLYNLSKGDCQNSGDSRVDCCEPCLEDLKRVKRILDALTTLQEQLTDVKEELDKRIQEGPEEVFENEFVISLRRKIIDKIAGNKYLDEEEEEEDANGTLNSNESEEEENSESDSEIENESMDEDGEDSNYEEAKNEEISGSDEDIPPNNDLFNLPSPIMVDEQDVKPEINELNKTVALQNCVESIKSTHVPGPSKASSSKGINSSQFQTLPKAVLRLQKLPLDFKSFTKEEELTRKTLQNPSSPQEESSTELRCGFCGQFVKSERSLTSHIKKRHEEVKKSCSECSYKTSDLIQLNLHMLNHNTDTFPIFTCHLAPCTKKYHSKGLLNAHLKSSHSSGRKVIPKTRKRRSTESRIICDYEGCSKRFQSEARLKSHKKRFHFLQEPEGPVLCSVAGCGKYCKTEKSLYIHMRNLHPQEPEAICDFEGCNKSFASFLYMRAHQKRVHLKLLFKYPCRYCSKLCANPHTRKHHEIKHSNQKNYTCDQCPAAFKRLRNLKEHQTRFHTKETFPCTICNQIFDLDRKLREHKCPGPSISPDVFLCPIETCRMQFASFGALSIHSRFIHQQEVQDQVLIPRLIQEKERRRPSLSCPGPTEGCSRTNCTETFASKRGLMAHLGKPIVYKPKEESPESFLCEFCPKSFKAQISLKRHQRNIHSGLPPVKKAPTDQKSFICDVCGRSFGKITYLTMHRKEVHEGAFNHYCSYCGRGFYYSFQMRIHIKTIHEKRFKCSFCPKMLPTLTTKKVHELSHSEEKNVKCPECGKAYKKMANMKEHFASVHSNEVHPCECGRTFKIRPYLLAHKRKCTFKEFDNKKNHYLKV